MHLFGQRYQPYRTLYEQYLEYPTIVWPMVLGRTKKYDIIPNGIERLSSYPVPPNRFYLNWLDASAKSKDEYIEETGLRGVRNLTQLELQFVSEAHLYRRADRENRGLLHYFLLPAMATELEKTKLTFSGKHLAAALQLSCPFIIDLPDNTVSYQDGRFISSMLVDYQSSTAMGIEGPDRHFLVIHYWWSPLPTDRHPGEVKTDTSIVMMEPDQTLEEIVKQFQLYIQGGRGGPSSEEGDPGVPPEDQVQLVRKLYSIVVGCSVIISSESSAKEKFITPHKLPARRITPKVLVPTGEGVHLRSYPNNQPCPCSSSTREPFRYHCKPRLRETTVAITAYIIGENFQQQTREEVVPPHLQVYWHKYLPDGQKTEPFPVIQSVSAYARAARTHDIEVAKTPERWRYRRAARKMKYQVPEALPPVSFPEPAAEPISETVVRDTAVVRWLKELYNNTCQMCGYRVVKPDGTGYSIGAHIMPFAEFPHLDIPENILVLCPLHHDEFDLGSIRVDVDLFYWLREHRLQERAAHPGIEEVPIEYIEGFVIKHLFGSSTPYSAAVHDKQLQVIPPGDPRFPQGHCLNPFYFEYRFRKQCQINEELGELWRWPRIGGSI